MSNINFQSAALLCASILAAVSTCASAQDATDPPAQDAVELDADEIVWGAGDESGDDTSSSALGSFGDNLRVDVDFLARVQTTSRRAEAESFLALGLDIRKVFSDAQGDIGTAVLQPYLVRKDNAYMMPTRMIDTDQDDAFSVELHDFYFNYTKLGRGKTNIKIGHFDVPFGIDPLVDTHFTLRQYQAMHDAGFKKDWGVSLNGALPDLDYAVSVTTGTGKDLTGISKDPHLFAGRVGTPSDRNTIFGLSALYGEVIDDHGAHRVDEGDPRGDFRQMENIVRRWRVGLDGTHIVNQWTIRGETTGGKDFDQTVFDALAEVEWTNSTEMFSAYLQGRYNGQDGFEGWSADVQSRAGLRWRINSTVALSAQWIHEFEHFASDEGGLHRPEDTYSLQFRVRF
jgi:hypothetical protein